MSEVCRRHGLLVVADEVMTGFGRTGKWFACDHWSVRPDVLVCGKGASSGYWPLGLTVASGEVFETVRSAGAFVHGFTWSHHPIGAAVGHAVLRRLRDDGLVERAATLGQRLHNALHAALGDDPHVGEVRGIGLLAGVELVRDRETKRPFPRSAQAVERVVAAAASSGLLVYPSVGCADGTDGDIVMLGPPFTITESQIDAAVDLTRSAVAALRS
ncbi:MAG: aminotransferase class III-fold pyridoxal phosphate-dependent enzyme [Acidimicrobiia bacterium]|nr:aminotransferase class III-fold pyridoxal phosphate-dependent enzyme [Acidimicrobiia bacterium]